MFWVRFLSGAWLLFFGQVGSAGAAPDTERAPCTRNGPCSMFFDDIVVVDGV